ncbi:DUF3135 domain-containing protein [Oceanospirillum linum]|uniref:DUF3135 domain-containing protein n=1 Tax=Oceanospirillum linum TaxID=966 RepID=A0A1T1HDY0_OCELI|nr:DUF3135 domain-containing protein [Oceanospirillum linum]OOV88068.1 hypothetical protein BTA35_0200465 [Oceanospirillum linum]SEF42002.1 Protein of unknown function [Oleiphilus messinensis]SMP00922.1 Protein of unknown function [Oceanospirillum linum]
MTTQLPSFDVLMDLAQNNPEQLEQIRNVLSEEIIQNASPRARNKLKGIIFRVDMERQRSKTPLQSCIRIAVLMQASYGQMREKLDLLFQAQPLRLVPPTEIPEPEQTDNVLPFRSANK